MSLKLQIIPFKTRHVQMVSPNLPPEMMELAAIGESHYGFTACLLGDPVACAGVVMQQAGIGEVWSIFSPLVKRLPLQMFKECKRLMAEVIATEKPTKLYTVIDPNDETAIRFVSHLGFNLTRHMYTREFAEAKWQESQQPA